MNDRMSKILDIIDNKSIRLRESYFINNHPDIYNDILEYCNKISDLPFIQKIWHFTNYLDDYYYCKCGNRTSFNRNWLDGYRKHCSSKCAQIDKYTKDKRKKTVLDKYNVDNVSKSSLVKDKIEKTNIEKWGVKSTFQNREVRNKWSKNMLDKYGVDHFFKTDEFKIKAKEYYLNKWGVEHQSMVDEIQKRIRNTCFDKYGVYTYLNTDHARSCIKHYNKSSYEIEIIDWIGSLNIECYSSKYGIIPNLTIDIWIPEYRIGIEFNGLYWHSEIFKDKYYHQNKTLLCKNEGIHLIHIWEDDWIYKKDICKSIILNKLGLSLNKIPARKCIIKKITDNKIVSDFLNSNHIQGYTRFSDCYVLVHNDIIVSMMAFGWRSTNSKHEYELIRYCNILNTNVLGGASKLFNHFIKEYDIENITSYSDLSIFDGNLYKNLKFTEIKKDKILVNYWWVVNGVRRHRFNYNKQKLIKLGYDRTKTEVEIMHELKHYRIFGCGQVKWIWNKYSI